MIPQKELFLELEKEIQPSEFERYIKQVKLNEKISSDDFIIFNVPNEFIAKFLQTKYEEIFKRIYESKTNQKIKIIFTSKSNVNPKKEIKKEKTNIKSTILNESYSFDNFIVGDSNMFAFNCSKYVAENPGKNYNPLFLYGASGLGKTHLLQSIGNYCISKGKIVICITSEQFINDFTFNIKNRTMENFTNKYRNCDILLIDDVQFLGKTEKIQEEFFHTFNELKAKNGQIVMTSDKPPKFLNGFEERLLSRFQSGLIADITPPELETKVAIIQRKSQDNKIILDQNVINYIATNMGDNIREIESALNKLNAFSSLMRTEISLDFAKNVMHDQIKEKREQVTLERIIEIISKELNVKPSQIKGKSRIKNIVEARRIGIYLSKHLTPNSMPAIASFFGLKDHSAVSHNLKKINELINKSENNALKIKIEEIKNKILIKDNKNSD